MIYIFTDANETNIGYVAYDDFKDKIIDMKKKDNSIKINKIKDTILDILNKENKEITKKKLKDLIVSINELDSIRFAAKQITKHIYSEDLGDFDIEFYIDNTNAQKAFKTIISDNCLPPDKDRLDIHSEYVKPIMEKIEKHICTFDYIDAYHCPAHCKSKKEAKNRFKQYNSKEVIKEFDSMTKKERKSFIKFLMKGNHMVDEFIKD